MGSICSCIQAKPFDNPSSITIGTSREFSLLTEYIPDEHCTQTNYHNSITIGISKELSLTERISDEHYTQTEYTTLHTKRAKSPNKFSAISSILSQTSVLYDSESTSQSPSLLNSLPYIQPISIVHLAKPPKQLTFSICSRNLIFAVDNNIKIYNLEDHSTEILYGCSRVNCIAISRDNKYIIAGCTNRVFLWNLCTGIKESELIGHFSRVTSVDFTPDCKYIISSSEDNSLRIWRFLDRKMIGVLRGHYDKVICICISYDSRIIVSGSSNGSLILWSIDSRSSIAKIQAYEGEVSCVAIMKNGTYFLSGGKDWGIKMWNLETKELKDCLRHEGRVSGLRISMDDRYAVCYGDDMVRVFNLISMIQMYTVNMKGKIYCLAVSESDTVLACGRENRQEFEIALYK